MITNKKLINGRINDLFSAEQNRKKLRDLITEITDIKLESVTYKLGDRFKATRSCYAGEEYVLVTVGGQFSTVQLTNFRSGGTWSGANVVANVGSITEEEFLKIQGGSETFIKI